MAGLDGTIKTSEYRPCVVKGKKALFHRWYDFSNVIGESIALGGHSGGQIKYTLGIIEYEDGSVAEVSPQNIQFLDNKISEYCFD